MPPKAKTDRPKSGKGKDQKDVPKTMEQILAEAAQQNLKYQYNYICKRYATLPLPQVKV
jgi:hypothetical protein